jgi:hypothetical protein
MGIRVTIKGLEDTSKLLTGLPASLERDTINKMAEIAHASARSSLQRHSKTGRLLASLYNKEISNGREVGNDPYIAPHAIFVHFGSKPHWIRPRADGGVNYDATGQGPRKVFVRKFLRFPVPGQYTGYIFAREVFHPGYRGDPYFERAADDAIQEFNKIVSDSLKRAAE